MPFSIHLLILRLVPRHPAQPVLFQHFSHSFLGLAPHLSLTLQVLGTKTLPFKSTPPSLFPNTTLPFLRFSLQDPGLLLSELYKYLLTPATPDNATNYLQCKVNQIKRFLEKFTKKVEEMTHIQKK